MSKLISFLIAGLVLVSFSTHAKVCTNGVLGGDDRYKSITLNADSIEIALHESFFTVYQSSYKADPAQNYVLIPSQLIKKTAEGDEYISNIYSMILFKDNLAIVYLELDGVIVSQNETFICQP